MTDEERIARAFHDTQQHLARKLSYETRKAVPWEKVPFDQRRLLAAVFKDLLERGVIQPAEELF